MSVRRKLVAANWKMNGSLRANEEWLKQVGAAQLGCDALVCAPFVYLPQVIEALRQSAVGVGAQNISEQPPGALTGEIAADMLVDIGCSWVIVGHSERRAVFGETDAVVAAKMARAVSIGLKPIACVGESLAEREAGRTLEVVKAQVAQLLACGTVVHLAQGAVAYEPVWAIGTGKTATPEQAQEVHAAIRAQLAGADAQAGAQVRILYGGSVKPGNAAELFAQPDIDGGLIGGASLNAGDFVSICRAAD